MATIIGTIGNNNINGGSSDDTISARAGNDTLNGNTGNDVLNGEDGEDYLNGSAGNDVLDGSNDNDTLEGGTGNDTIAGGYGNDLYLFGKGDGQDILPLWYYTDSETNTLLFNSTVNPSEVVGMRFDNNLLLSIIGTTDKITINDFFYNDNPYNNRNPLQQIQFSDGTTWDLDAITNIAFNGIPNSTPTGTVTITGKAIQAQILTASNTLVDTDGLGAITYQWQANGVNIGVGNSYTITNNEVGKTISVTATYTDLLGNPESVSSQATSTIKANGISADSIFNTQGENNKDVGIMRVMADFSKAAYSLQTWENSIYNDTSDNSDTAFKTVKAEGWQPLNLTIPTLTNSSFPIINHSGFISSTEYYNATNKMQGGYYTNNNAAAFVARAGDALVLSFRGTNDNADTTVTDPNNDIHPDADEWGAILDGSSGDMNDYYGLLQPLLTAFDEYVADNSHGISKVYVTGHSLGGAMAINYMNIHSGSQYQAITFAAPAFTGSNAWRDGFIDDSRITQIEISEDPVPQTWDVGINHNRPGEVIRFAGNETLNEPNYHGTFWGNDNNHSMDYYREITKSVSADAWQTILAETGDQEVYFGGRAVGTGFIVDGRQSPNNGIVNNGNNTLTDPITWDYDTYYGGSDNKLLLGGEGKDNLKGNGGLDRLFGGSGNDTLTGGSGTDSFVFNTALNAIDNIDIIKDFNVKDDTLVFNNSIFTKFATTGQLAASMFTIGTASNDSDDYFVYNKTNGALFYDADGNSSSSQIQVATLGIKLALTNADFVII